MEFYYPNFNNDMWRIMGLIFYNDRDRFVVEGAKRFDRDRVIRFCTEYGIAIYDSACAVRRRRGNASDQFLEVVEPSDIAALIRSMPLCRAVVTTGERSATTLAAMFGCAVPAVGSSVEFESDGRTLLFFRMPSSSRAYPLALPLKADSYRAMFVTTGVLR